MKQPLVLSLILYIIGSSTTVIAQENELEANSALIKWLINLTDYELGAVLFMLGVVIAMAAKIYYSHLNRINDLRGDFNDYVKKLATLQEVALLNSNYRHRVRTHGSFIRDIMRQFIQGQHNVTFNRDEDKSTYKDLVRQSETDSEDENQESQLLGRLSLDSDHDGVKKTEKQLLEDLKRNVTEGG